MSGHDAFERILTSLHEAMLDDVHWPTTTALIDEACGLTSNALLVGEGPKDDLRVLFAGLYYRGQRRETWNESTSRSTIPSTNVCRACSNCPTRGPRPSGARPRRCCVIRARGEPGREAHPPQYTRSDRGIPSSAIRFSTAHLIAASTFWFLTVRAERLTPSIALYRETAFSATLWRVQPLDFHHS